MPRLLRSLYICYYPLTEPLVQTQVVAYLEGLARHGHHIHLLSFETAALSPAQKRATRRQLREKGIRWHHLRYHKRPSLPATVFDTLCGIWVGARIVRRHRLQAVHARSHIPATMALALKKLLGTRLIFDIRGLLAEEYVDTGNWQQGSLPFRLTKTMERKCIQNADGLVVLTERVKELLFGANSNTDKPADTPVFVIPCCADLSQIEEQASQRQKVRAQLGLEDKTVMIYVGKFGGWYLQREMVEFFAKARQSAPNLHFLVLSQSEAQLIRDEFARANVGEDAFTIMQVAPERVGAHLWASDFAISFIRALPSKVASSPTKIGEYLAAGLPLVCNRGVGDMDSIVDEFGVGASLDEFCDEAYARVAEEVLALIGKDEVRARCQDAARAHASLQEVGVPRYCALYEAVAATI